MLILGVILLLIGWLVGIHPLFLIGLILAVIGLILLLFHIGGNSIGGRMWY